MKSSNTVLRKATEACSDASYGFAPATYLGVGLKTLYYVLLTIAGAFLGIYLLLHNSDSVGILLLSSGLVTFIAAMLAMNFPKLSLIFGSIYCLLEGIFLGAASLLLEYYAPGVVITAIVATMAVVCSCAFLYISGLVKVTNRFRKILFMFAISFMVTMLVLWIMSLFGAVDMSNIGVMLLIDFLSTALAILFLFNDFEYAKQIVENNGPKELEWMIAFGIAYTVLWLYYEILRLVYTIFGRN